MEATCRWLVRRCAALTTEKRDGPDHVPQTQFSSDTLTVCEVVQVGLDLVQAFSLRCHGLVASSLGRLRRAEGNVSSAAA